MDVIWSVFQERASFFLFFFSFFLFFFLKDERRDLYIIYTYVRTRGFIGLLITSSAAHN